MFTQLPTQITFKIHKNQHWKKNEKFSHASQELTTEMHADSSHANYSRDPEKPISKKRDKNFTKSLASSLNLNCSSASSSNFLCVLALSCCIENTKHKTRSLRFNGAFNTN